ncbi:hypothetical protein PX860_14305 [Agrobacterium leguminum]|uniref:hypothetical protein n=1 Tax=Agrobacterium leguminum TaxID=2792015 RepID=UPI00272B35C8|nr:hypothetical protein [Agrobacterium leguminum]WLD96693.1 hypothetical protein PX860_14305 [Agrobacterium leguminum]
MGIRATFLALISVLLMLVGGPAWAASPSPEEIAELYYRAWLNFDRASMSRLNREWGASGGGPRYIDMELVADPVAWQRKNRGMHSPKGTTNEQSEQFARLWVASTERVRCKAEPARLGAQTPAGVIVARIKMNCSLPDVAPAFQRLKASANANETGDRTRMPSVRLMKQMVEATKAAPLTHKVSTEIQLFSGPDKAVWRVGSAENQPQTGIDRVSSVFLSQMVQSGLLQ